MEQIETTVLFGDIKGYTQICKRLDSTVLRGLLDELFDVTSRTIDSQVGIINKVLGDGIMAFFRDGDHEERAVAAALSIQENADRLRPKWQAAGADIDLRIRIGIATGVVSAGERRLKGHVEYSLDGEAVTLAARLQEKAPPGGILISRETCQKVSGSLVCEKIPDLELRGYDDVRTAWLVAREGGLSAEVVPAVERRRRTDSGDDPPDGRLHPRRDLHVEIRCDVGRSALSGRTVNVSAGGLFMESDARAPVGSEIVIHTRMPTAFGTFPIDIRGKIVRIADGGFSQGLGVEFLGAETEERGTTSEIARAVFGIVDAPDPELIEEFFPDDEGKTVFHPSPVFCGKSLPLAYDELGTGTPEDLTRRIAHEIKRARRYGTEFALVAVKIHNLDLLPDRKAVGAVIRDVDIGFRAAVRNTDDITYLEDGVFLLLAPETMLDRAVTLARRVVENVHKRIESLPGGLNNVYLRTGVASFDGETAPTPGAAMTATLERCN